MTQAAYSPLAAIYIGWLFYMTQNAFSRYLYRVVILYESNRLFTFSRYFLRVCDGLWTISESTGSDQHYGQNTWCWACSQGARGGGDVLPVVLHVTSSTSAHLPAASQPIVGQHVRLCRP